MKTRYLEVTYRHGKPFAAYLYLPRQTNDHSVRVERWAEGLLVDRAEDGRAIGIEMPDPTAVDPNQLNALLVELHEGPLSTQELAPLAY